MSFSNQKYMVQPTLINLYPKEYTQEFHYYLFAVKLEWCIGSCNTLNNLSNKVCFPNKTEDLKSKHFRHDCRNKWMENINKAYIMWM